MITAITDIPPCPLCGKLLCLRSMPDTGESHWHCTGCGTQWEVSDLIEALNQNAAIAWAREENKEITGVRNVDEYSQFFRSKGSVVTIRGFPPCPECHHVLSRDWATSNWYCLECGTVWTREELIDAIERENALCLSTLTNACAWCGKPVTEFRDALSRQEYSISGFCQECQDDTCEK